MFAATTNDSGLVTDPYDGDRSNFSRLLVGS